MVEWYTPIDIIEAARRTMGGIDLDPASDEEANRIVKAERYFGVADDGLLQPWAGRVWLNPPFGARDTRKFVGKLVSCYDEGGIEQACVLLIITPGSGGKPGNVATANSGGTLIGRFPFCYPFGKVLFLRPYPLPSSDIQFPVFVFYLGPHVKAFAHEFSALGAVCGPLAQYRSQTGILFET